jgi:hypothetical protein
MVPWCPCCSYDPDCWLLMTCWPPLQISAQIHGRDTDLRAADHHRVVGGVLGLVPRGAAGEAQVTRNAPLSTFSLGWRQHHTCHLPLHRTTWISLTMWRRRWPMLWC